MPLYVPPAPAPALRSVLAALDSPTAVREARTPSLRQLRDPLIPSCRFRSMCWTDIMPSGGPPRTRLTGWRFLIRSGDRAVAAADAKLTDGRLDLLALLRGPLCRSHRDTPCGRPRRCSTHHQPRLLSVPELYMLTLWLHGDTRRRRRRRRPLRPLGPAGTARARAARGSRLTARTASPNCCP